MNQKTSTNIESQIKSILKRLGMPFAVFSIEIKESDNLSVNGQDEVVFLFSANKGIKAEKLSSIISGGELSRLMLAIKYISAKYQNTETLIFDEIDSGISGEAAERVGSALKALAIEKQVICITHLPQIASCAEHHLYINKKIENEQTDVMARYLNEKEKVEAIAQLFSGESISVEGISSAKQLRNQARG